MRAELTHDFKRKKRESTKCDKNVLIPQNAEELEELNVSKGMKLTCNYRKDLSYFWLPAQDADPLLNKKASLLLIHFVTAYLFEFGLFNSGNINSLNHGYCG